MEKATQEQGFSQQHPGSTIHLEVKNLAVSIVSGDAPLGRLYEEIKQRTTQYIKGKNHGTATQEAEVSWTAEGVIGRGHNILKNVSMATKPGQVCLIMGSSGSGKTTLLNTLAGRMDPHGTAISDSIRMNGDQPQKYWASRQVGYIQQEEHLLPHLTVKETLSYSADFCLSPNASKAEKEDIVTSLLTDFGLQSCANVIIGETDAPDLVQTNRRGISGGERKRLSTATQLLFKPKLLFCDEVTSGLDAHSALELVKILKTYAEATSSTVVISIHQPRSEIYHLLSRSEGQLVVLSKGDVVYSGQLSEALPWFGNLGFNSYSEHMNPLDYMLHLSTVDYSSPDTEKSTRERCEMLIASWKE
ncbi:hypothetical protein BGW38_003016 [Lunasporangiospora selenospora]|uniref:ABC transporter domain-containing protein n=1 Tax=Lunasporangiospora selenospora TaxID=979761 RepID=A0A9P6FRL0_9FUNG|nr:hypothetical protein BGW38_003016 [Lunasporangiospora selenospora]